MNFESLKLKLKNGVETRWGTFHGKLLESKHIKNLKNDEEINLHKNFQQHLVHCCCKQQKNELLFTRQDGPNPFPSSPIIDKSHIEGLYLNCGWCYGGFKATPASGWTFAHTIAQDRVHDLNAGYSLNRFHTGYLLDEKGLGTKTWIS